MIRTATLVVSLLLGEIAHAATTGWVMDSRGSELAFAATFQRAPATGAFRSFSTTFRFDADRPAESLLAVTIDVRSADMGSDEVNRAIRGAEWFDAERFPVAEFRSTGVRRTGADSFVASGSLTLKGITRPVDVPFTWTEAGDAAVMTGSVTIARAAHAIGTGEWVSAKVVGADVRISFTVRLRKGG